MPRNDNEVEMKTIKIPAYISEPLTEPTNVVSTYLEMVNNMRNIIDAYNNREEDSKISNILRGKSIKKEIHHIDYDQYSDGETPVLLLRISEKKQGFTDLAVEGVNTSVVKQDDKLATQYNCAVLYPNIDTRGTEVSNNWITFVYIDPGKTDVDVISTVKMVLKRILKLKIKNVKSNTANELIRREGLIPKLVAQYVIVTNNENERLDIRGVQVKSTIKEVKKFEYHDIPAEDVEEYVNNQNDKPYLERKIVVSFVDNQELKYVHKQNEEQTLKDAIEQIYNYETDMLLSDFPRMYNSDFILEKVRGAARQFYSNE